MTDNPLLKRSQSVFSDGEWRSGTGAADVKAAAKTAANAFPTWKATPAAARIISVLM